MMETGSNAAAGAHRAPQPLTSFVGRERELASLGSLVESARLATLTGPGGAGKTRLAIALAARVERDTGRDVYVVPLAPVSEPAMVPVAIAQSLGLQDARGQPLLEHLTRYLSGRDMLLILDNFEHVLAAASFVGRLLEANPRLRILVTSRAPLHLAGEQEFPVPPLQLPDVAAGTDTESLADCESVRLFVERAQACVPTFAVTLGNAAAIAGIVQRLDGLPLAIELAAARVKLLPPQAILARLNDSLAFLVGSNRDAPDRHRTLRATIAWSHGLLSEPARAVLAACAGFRGGIGLDQLEAVCTRALPAFGVPLLDVVQELVDHSLLQLADSAAPTPRYAMLETIRDYAAEQLRESPAYARVRAAQAASMSALAKDLRRPPHWPERAGLDLLEQEHANFAAALDWYADTDPARGLELANRLTAFWSVRGHFSEGRSRLADLLGRVRGHDPDVIDGLNGAAWLATDQGDRAAAIPLLEEGLERARAVGDRGREATALLYRGRITLIVGNPQGRVDVERALRLTEAAGDEAELAATLWLAGAAAQFDDELDLAIERLARCVELADAARTPAVGARALQLLGTVLRLRGDLQGSRAALVRGTPAIVELGDRFAIPIGLSALVGLASHEGRLRTAFALAGAAAAYEELNHTQRPHIVLAQVDGWLEPARRRLGPAAEHAWRRGRELSPAEAVELGLAEREDDRWRVGGSTALTPREQQVATLVAEGLSNRDIAERLTLSVRTVEVHVDHILTKLGFTSRTKLAAWAYEHGLIRGN